MLLVKPSFEILSDLSTVLRTVERAGRCCYKSEVKINDTSAEPFVRMLIQRGHESVIEHASMQVKFVVDRGVTHEIVRHRLASYSQESTRYCDYNKSDHIAFVIPPWINIEPGEYHQALINIKEADKLWMTHAIDCEIFYKSLRAGGWAPEQARAVLPNSLKSELVVTANMREWRHILRLRTAKAAHPQMREVMVPLLTTLQGSLPALFNDITLEG